MMKVISMTTASLVTRRSYSSISRSSEPDSGRRPEKPGRRPSMPIRLSYECLLSCSLRSTSSRLKLAAFWRCGYSLNVCRNSPI